MTYLNVREKLSTVIIRLSFTALENFFFFKAIENFQYWKKTDINKITNHRIINTGNIKGLLVISHNADNLNIAIIYNIMLRISTKELYSNIVKKFFKPKLNDLQIESLFHLLLLSR